MNDRAIVYRRKYGIPAEWGTAVNVQAMVYGNTGDELRLRRRLHPRPGHRREDLLRRVPHQRPGRGRRRRRPHPEPVADLKKHLPAALVELERIRQVLESHFKDVQDFEFTIQDGKVFMLQTRNGKRTGVAAVRSPSRW
jgi:pyruvate,orthophosphate dikinase